MYSNRTPINHCAEMLLPTVKHHFDENFAIPMYVILQ